MKLHTQRRLQSLQNKEYCLPHCENSEQIRKNFQPSILVCRALGWEVLNDVTGIDTNKVDRLPVLMTSLVDGDTKLFRVPKIASGSGKAAAAFSF